MNKILIALIILNFITLNNLFAKDLVSYNINSITLSSLMESINLTKEQLNTPQNKRKVVEATVEVQINAPVSKVWAILTDFKNYPVIFSKIETCNVLKCNKSLVYIESFLKPQMFVKQTCQHTVNDLSQGPNRLSWYMLDGNFQYLEGSWQLLPQAEGKICKAIYTIKTIPGSVIPKGLVNVALSMIQHEVVNSLKMACEKTSG